MRRPGMTLMEMLVVLVVDATLTGVALAVLLTATHYQSEAGRETQCRATHARLAEQFRADVHAASDCRALDDSRGCRLSAGGGRRIEYRLQGPRVVRSVHEGRRLVERDTFALPADAQPALELPAAAGVVRLLVATDRSGPPWRVEACFAPRRNLVVEESRP